MPPLAVLLASVAAKIPRSSHFRVDSVESTVHIVLDSDGTPAVNYWWLFSRASEIWKYEAYTEGGQRNAFVCAVGADKCTVWEGGVGDEIGSRRYSPHDVE